MSWLDVAIVVSGAVAAYANAPHIANGLSWLIDLAGGRRHG